MGFWLISKAQKKTIMSLCPRNENADEVDFILQTNTVSFQFSPLRVLNIVYDVKNHSNPDEIVEMAEPCETKDIVGHGNCFFRSVDYAVSVSEQEHRKLRRAVVTHSPGWHKKWNMSELGQQS